MIYRTTACKTALSRSSLPGLAYSLNPYTGCEHGCIYCYAPSTIRYDGSAPWGTFVTAKENLPVVLEREVRRKKRGVVGISTVTDPYQPLEEKLRLTRSCLEVLLAKDFPVCVQTKSALVLRDLDLIRAFSEKEIGFTITTLSDELSALLEPGASSASDRLSAMKMVSDTGVPTWAFVGPLVPGIVDKDRLYGLLSRVRDAGVTRVLLDRLWLKPGLWPRMELALRMRSDVLEACRRALFTGEDTFTRMKADALAACKELDIECEPLY